MNARPSPPLIVLGLLLFALVLAAANLLIITANVLLLIFAGILFGVLVNGLANTLAAHTPLRYQHSFLLIVATMLLTIGLGAFFLGTQIAQRTDELRRELQSATQQLSERLQQQEWAQDYLPSTSEVQNLVASQGTDLLPSMWVGVLSAAWVVTCGLVIFFVGLYAAYDPDLYGEGVVSLVPPSRRPRAREVLTKLRAALSRWITGRLMSMTIVGVATSIGLWILGVPLALTLGLLAAFMTFIPNFGPLLAAVPQVLMAVGVGGNTVIYVIVFNVILQSAESYLITPLIQKHEVELPPLLTIAGQLLLGVTVGLIGIMMAAPLIVAAMVLVQMLYLQDYLGDREAGELTHKCQ